LLESGKIGGIVFLHQTIAVGAAEIEDVMRVFFKKGEIIVQGAAEEFVDDLGVLPAPLGIQVGVAHDVERGLFGQVWGGRLLSRDGSGCRRSV